MPTVLPVATFDKLKAVKGRQSVIALKVGVTTTVFLADYLGDASTIDIRRYTAPGADNGPAYTAGTWVAANAEMHKFRTKEIKKVIAAFGSLNFHKGAAKATLFVRDPDDAANKVALLSETEFDCSIYRDTGEVAHSPEAPSEITIVIESHKDGLITWTPDGTTEAPA